MSAKIIGLWLTAVILAGPACAAEDEKFGPWSVTVIRDPIADAARAVASVSGEGGLLAVKCDSPGADSLYIHWMADEYLGGDFQRREMTIRFDQEPPFNERWVYDRSDAAQTWDREAMRFARRLPSVGRVVLRGSDFRGGVHTGVWDLVPAETALAMQRVFQTCRAGAL